MPLMMVGDLLNNKASSLCKSVVPSRSEICLLYSHGATQSKTIPGIHRRTSIQLYAVDEPCSKPEISLHPKSASTLEPEINTSLASRSLESRCFAILVDLQSHRISATLEPVLMKAAEGLIIFHQVSSVPDPSVTLSRWYLSSPFLPALLPLPPARLQRTRIISSPPPSHHCQSSIVKVKGNLGFWLLGLSHFSPLCFPSWPIFGSGGPTPSSSLLRSVLLTNSFSPFGLLSRHIAMIGRRLFSLLVSSLVQGLFDYHSTNSKQLHSPTTHTVWIRIQLPQKSQTWSLNFSRSIVYPRQVSNPCGMNLIQLISDLEGLRTASILSVKGLLLQPSSSLERTVFILPSFREKTFAPWLSVWSPVSIPPNLYRSQTFLLSYVKEVIRLVSSRFEVLDLSSKSKCQSTMTICHSPDLLVDLASTHHLLACGKGPYPSCLRTMDLSSNYLIYLSFAIINVFIVLSFVLKPLNFVISLIIWMENKAFEQKKKKKSYY